MLGMRAPIPPRAWMFVSCVCFVGSGHCDELIIRCEESRRLRGVPRGGGLVVQPPPHPKFRSFDKAEPNSQFR
jgi:hypothetical protein